MAPIAIRRAAMEDLPTAALLFDQYRVFYLQSSDQPAATQFLSERMSAGESVLFLAFVGEKAAGFVQLYPSFSSVGLKRIWILNDLFVDPAFRKKGIARRLIEQTIVFTQESGYKKIILSTAPDNMQAQRLYESIGFLQSRFLEYELPVP